VAHVIARAKPEAIPCIRLLRSARNFEVKSLRLLLHICCGPCATTVIKRLKDGYEITGFFYNPNIFPEEEYQCRLEEAQKVVQNWKINLLTREYEHRVFLSEVRGLENEPEGGKRCEICFRLRLEKSALQAKELGCALLASTLTIGPNKNAEVINRIGKEVCAPLGIDFLEADWKKNDGFRQSVELSRKLGLYRQHYCGCEFSIK